MQGIDYTRGRLFTKKRRKRITDVRVLADREERNVVTPVINSSGTISFSFNFDGNDPVGVKVKKNKIVLRKRVKITQTKLRLTPKSPRKGVNYYELNYGTECIRCGRALPDLSVLNRKKEPEELCLVFKRKKREEVKKWYGSLKAIAQEEHNSYTDWVRRKGYTESINIVRRT